MSAVLDALPAGLDVNARQPGKAINGKRIRVPPRVTLGEITPNNIGTVKKLNMVSLIGACHVILVCLFPVAYSEQFYRDVLNESLTPEQYSSLVYYQDVPVGNVICRIESASAPAPATINDAVRTSKTGSDPAKKLPSGPAKLYVMTLGVLSPYRRQGLASKLISHVIEAATASHDKASDGNGTTASANKADTPSADKKQKKATDDKKADEAKDKKTEQANAGPSPVIESMYLHVQTSNDEARRFWESHGFEVKETVSNYYRKIEPRDAWVMERKIVAKAKNTSA